MKTYTGKEWVEKMRAKTYTVSDFQKWGAIGGAKSKRVLTAAQAKAMVRARTAKRARLRPNTKRSEPASNTYE